MTINSIYLIKLGKRSPAIGSKVTKNYWFTRPNKFKKFVYYKLFVIMSSDKLVKTNKEDVGADGCRAYLPPSLVDIYRGA